VLAQIQSYALFFVTNSKFHEDLQNKKYQGRADNGKEPGGNHSDKLRPKLTWIAEEEAIVPRGVDRLGGKESRCKCPNRTTDAVNPDNIEGIVVAEFGLQTTGERANYATGDPNPYGRDRPNVSRCRCDSDEPSDSTA